MTVRKYVTEGCLNLFCGNPMLVQHHRLDHPQVVADLSKALPHIYIVCSRPRITFDPASLVYGRNTMSGRFVVQERTRRVEVPFTSKISFDPSEKTLVCDYPFNEMAFFNKDGTLQIKSHSSYFMILAAAADELHDRQHGRFLDLEVLYVGQSYGADGSRTAPDRLKSHETLLAIYSELSALT